MEAEYARRRILQCGRRHEVITQRLDEIGPVQSQITANNDTIYTTTGKLKVSREKLTDLDANSKSTFKAYRSLTSSAGKRALIKLSGARARKVEKAKASWEHAYGAERRLRDEVHALEERLAFCQRRKESLAQDKIESTDLNIELEDLYDSIFGSEGVAEWPHEHAASSWHAINKESAVYLAAEAAREKRATENLHKALKHADVVVKDLQAALQVCIDTGIATNTKYTKQILVGNSSTVASKSTTPLLLNAKRNSGKLFTVVAETRGGQPHVKPLPTLEIIELHKMPGRQSEKAVSEKGLHRSLEMSYTQAKRCAAHVRSEINISKERSRLYARAAEDLKLETEKSLYVQRAVRRDLIHAVLRGEEVLVPPLGAGEGGLDAQAIKLRARDALRKIVRAVRAEAEGDADDEVLPGYEYVFNQ